MQANLTSYQTTGAEALLTIDQKGLESMYRKANKTYREGEPIMSDAAFDVLEDHIRERFPASKVLAVVGAKTKRVEVPLPYTLFSMNKIKPGEGKLAAWKAKYSGPYAISAKLDGASVLYELKTDGARLLTHGEVKKGNTSQKGGDVSHLVPLIGLAPKLPTSIPDTLMIRGEVILKRKVFEDKYADDYANPRNLAAGLLNALDTTKHGDRQRDLEFVAFEVIEPKGLTPTEQFAFLAQHAKTLGLEVVENKVIAKPSELTEERLSQEFTALRESHPYECDGVIVADDRVYPRKNQNPDHALAFKMTLTDEIVKATVRTVSWRVTKDGYLKPTVHLHPVKVPGATVEKATGHDAKKIRDRKIGPGAVVEVIRRGQVIPHIERVLTPATAAAVKESWWEGPHEWSESGVDIRLPADARKDDQWNTEIRFSNLHRFFAKIKAKSLGEKTMRKLFDSGYDTVKKLAAATPQELTRLEGIQATSARNIVDSVKKALAEASAQQLMVGSNLFGRNTGNTISAQVLAKYPNVLHFKARDAGETRRLVAGLVTIKGISDSRATQFVAAIPEFREFVAPFRPELVAPWPLDRVLAAGTLPKKASPVVKGHPLAGREVITTGVKHNLVEPHLDRVGATLGSRVNAQTAAVIIKDEPGYASTKTKAAEKHGVPQLTLPQFMEKFFPDA
jgi:DNA ligase (NAD+)